MPLPTTRLLLLLLGCRCCFAFEWLVVSEVNGTSHLPLCYNDSDCSSYGDCCHGNGTTPTSATPCQPATIVYGSTRLLLAGIRLVSDCPQQRRCRQADADAAFASSAAATSAVAAPGHDAFGRVFASAECAACNSARLTALANLRVTCPTRSSQLEMLLAAQQQRRPPFACQSAWLLPLSSVRLCQLPAPVAGCPNRLADTQLGRRCEIGERNLRIGVCGRVYKNEACEACWNDTACDAVFDHHPGGFHTLLTLRLVMNLPVSEPDNATSGPSNSTLISMASSESVVNDAIVVATLAASVVSLVVLATTYLSLPSLRNQSGSMLASHSVALATSELCHLASHFSSAGSPQCEILSLATFYCTCCAFGWAAAFGLQLLRCLRSGRPGGPRPVRYWRVALLGWGLPAVLAAANALTHALWGLLDTSRCQFRRDRLLAMVCLSFGPLCSALLFNMSLAAVLACRLAPQRRVRLVTVKVTLILGIAWVPYFAAQALVAEADSPVLLYADLLCGSHGLLLTLCFLVFNRRARRCLAAAVDSKLKRRRQLLKRQDLTASDRGSGGNTTGSLLTQ